MAAETGVQCNREEICNAASESGRGQLREWQERAESV
jgi:hypothetical protein